MSIAHAAQIKAYAQQRNNDLTPIELKKLDRERDAKNKSYSIDIKKLEDAITGHKELLDNLGYQEPVTAKRSSAEEMNLVRSIRETSLAVDKELDNEDKRITMKPDTTDVKHAAIASFLKQDWIPVFAGTKTVDFSRVKLMEFKDSPELTFDKLNLDKEELPLEIVLRIINFRRDFKEFYMRHLSAVLFDDMVQYYAKGALRKAGFASHFKHELDKYDRNQRDWHAVKKCINKVLNVETLRGKIIQALFNVSPKASEH
ncbi:hypothetical protein BG011_003228, partial [Mortierella polycephala]